MIIGIIILKWRFFCFGKLRIQQCTQKGQGLCSIRDLCELSQTNLRCASWLFQRCQHRDLLLKESSPLSAVWDSRSSCWPPATLSLHMRHSVGRGVLTLTLLRVWCTHATYHVCDATVCCGTVMKRDKNSPQDLWNQTVSVWLGSFSSAPSLWYLFCTDLSLSYLKLTSGMYLKIA